MISKLRIAKLYIYIYIFFFSVLRRLILAQSLLSRSSAEVLQHRPGAASSRLSGLAAAAPRGGRELRQMQAARRFSVYLDPKR